MDHINPVASGGADSMENWATTSMLHNSFKSNWTLKQLNWRLYDAGDGAQRLFDSKHGLIYPDFIGRDGKNRIIADAKYKPVNNISGKDYLQILAYMFRFNAKRGYFLYPEVADLLFHLNQGITYENNVFPRNDISVVKCGLQIPDGAKDYADFVARMEENETAFRDKIWKTEA